jgi:hypothetical protein
MAAGTRCGLGAEEAASRSWVAAVTQGRSDLFTFLGLSPMNFGSRAYYRHDGRGSLPTDLVMMLLIKTLIGV